LSASRCFIALVLLCGAVPARAQTAPRYLVRADTLRYETDNPFRMYWVRGTDTIGAPRRSRAVEAHSWSGTARAPELAIRQVSLGVDRRTRSDTFAIAPDGRVRAINGAPPTSSSRFDLLLRLPSTPLRAGSTWSDTVGMNGTGPGGAQGYEVTRSYRVVRFSDTLAARGVAHVEARGRIRFRFGFWADSAAGRAAWIDVAGPVTEHYLFDAAGGRLLRREWTMDLRGRGVPPDGADTIPAGLRSGQVQVISESPRTRFLLAPLPGADTSVTVRMRDEAPILLHTVQREPGRIRSSLSVNDGVSGTASVTFRDGRVEVYEATWADSTPRLITRRIEAISRGLVLRRDGAPDTTLATPEGSWGVADYSMNELLAPVLLALPRDGAPHPVAVFRPFAMRWDLATAVVANRGGVILAALRVQGSEQPETMVLTPEGDFLFGVSHTDDEARRVPTDAVRQARLRAVTGEMGP
jgi:hypothetical protein